MTNSKFVTNEKRKFYVVVTIEAIQQASQSGVLCLILCDIPSVCTVSRFVILACRLEVTLFKESPGAWPIVVVGDTRGQLVLDEAQRQRVHEQLAHLTSDTWVQTILSWQSCHTDRQTHRQTDRQTDTHTHTHTHTMMLPRGSAGTVVSVPLQRKQICESSSICCRTLTPVRTQSQRTTAKSWKSAMRCLMTGRPCNALTAKHIKSRIRFGTANQFISHCLAKLFLSLLLQSLLPCRNFLEAHADAVYSGLFVSYCFL